MAQETFFIWEGVTQYITESAVRGAFDFFAGARRGSRIVFTYVLKDFIDGKRTFGQERLYKQARVREQLWQFGLEPQEVPAFIGQYSWQELEHIGAEDYRHRYLVPLSRTEALMTIERMVYAQKR